MRSYTNSNGEVIEVSDAHIETAIRLKLELQNLSPSRRVSWVLHKQLMEKEGFYDSDTNENYRVLIKDEQKKRGLLPSAPKHADMVTTSKLESIKELVGELRYEKQENLNYLRQINQGKRELINFALIAEQIGEAFRNHDFSSLRFDSKSIEQSNGKKMVVCLSDLHVGALVENEYNTYNYEVAQRRMQQYLHKVIEECKLHNITDVFVMNLGDVIEHSYMRFGQPHNIEFAFSEQIVKATDLIIKFLIGLAEHVASVRYAGISGNHDRVSDDKEKNLFGDSVVRPINYAIQQFIENAKIDKIKYEQANDYSHSLHINGVNIKCVHGDQDSIRDESIIAKHSAMDGVNYDLLICGHFHHHRDIEVGMNKRIIAFGTLKGADDYGVKLKKLSTPSQGFLIIDESGNVDVKRVGLD